MAIERTLSIIKPDGVAKNIIGKIYSRFEKAGLGIIAAKMQHLSKEQAGEFYAVHKERPFYNDLWCLVPNMQRFCKHYSCAQRI